MYKTIKDTSVNARNVSDVEFRPETACDFNIYDRLLSRDESISVVGLGYVGLPIALELARDFNVIGFDINQSRINMMRDKIDPSGELVSGDFESRRIQFTADSSLLSFSKFIIVAVPTPVNSNNEPDLTPLTKACESLAKNLTKGAYVVFESTVYPGCTDEICVPILEKGSGLKLNVDFKVGYSPERINPGDKVNTLTKIKKIVSGSDAVSEQEIYKVYDHIIDAGIHLAPSIKVAEAAKILENTQRDVNIGLMNELSPLFDSIGISTHDVLAAAGTKWNFLNFYPGLVGGHCIGVDPYYLIYKAQALEMDLPIISSTRKTNDGMAQNIVDQIDERLQAMGKKLGSSKVLVLGATFKENVSDLRNSKTAEMCQILNDTCNQLDIYDPHADPNEFNDHYGLDLSSEISDAYDVIVYAVNHSEFEAYNWHTLDSILSDKSVIYDFKMLLGKEHNLEKSICYLTL